MKLDKAQLIEKLAIVLAFVKRFRFLLTFIVFSVMYGYIMVQVNTFSNELPSDKQVSDKVTASPRPKIDKELIETITSLEDQNIQIKTIFNEARKNPFNE